MGKRLYRSRQEKVLAGICGGFGEYFEVDPTIMRLALILLVFASGGAVILAYLLGWIIIPREPLPEIVRPTTSQPPPQATPAPAGPARERSAFIRALPGIMLALFGLIALGNHLWWWRWSHLMPIALIFLGVYMILRNWDDSRAEHVPADATGKPANGHSVSHETGAGGEV